jgi:hypothetical protein
MNPQYLAALSITVLTSIVGGLGERIAGGLPYGGVVPGQNPVVPTALPIAPIPTALPGLDGSLVDASVGAVGTDISAIILVLAGIFAAIGFFRGSRRELLSLLAVLPAYLLFSRGWTSVAALINKFWKLFYFAVFQRGILADNPGEAWNQAAGLAPLVNPTQSAPLAQMAVFGLAVVLAYVATRSQGEPSALDRLVGAVVGSVTGYIVGVFTLSRVVPEATIAISSPGSMALRWVDRLGPVAVLTVVGAVILFGFKSLGPRGYKQKFG